MSKFRSIAMFMAALFTNASIAAEMSLNGFGSVYAGKVTSGNEFLADYPKTGIYDGDLSFKPDTTLGVQFLSGITDEFSLIAQVVVNGASEDETEVDWLYVSYQVTPRLSIQAGRKRLPLYYYSDFFDVGYAYNWIRPPADLYTWQITSYNGVSLMYEQSLGEWDTSLSIYYGSEESNDNELLGLLFGVPVDEKWKDMVGGVGSMANEWIDVRLSYMEGLVDRDINGVNIIDDISQQFLGVSINVTVDALQILSELNNYKRPDNNVNVDTSMLSFAYQVNDFTPHITRSSFEQEINASGNDEKHSTTTLGIRWDFYKNIAFKVQYDDVDDEGVVVPIRGDSKSITFGIDFVF